MNQKREGNVWHLNTEDGVERDLEFPSQVTACLEVREHVLVSLSPSPLLFPLVPDSRDLQSVT